jgi:hypothetical protein
VMLLDEIAVAHALVAALDAAASAGTEPSALVGRARTAYDAVRSLDLIGLGGRPWRTGSVPHLDRCPAGFATRIRAARQVAATCSLGWARHAGRLRRKSPHPHPRASQRREPHLRGGVHRCRGGDTRQR